MTFTKIIKATFIYLLLCNSLTAIAQMDYQFNTGFFTERKRFYPKSEKSASQLFWTNDDYLFLRMKVSDAKHRSIIVELPFDVGFSLRQWSLGIKLPIKEKYSIGFSFRQTENTMMLEKINQFISAQHPQYPAENANLDRGYQYNRTGYVVGVDVGYQTVIDNVSFEQELGFSMGNIQKYSLSWWHSDFSSNLLLYEQYVFEASKQYMLQGKTAVFVYLFGGKKVQYELGYEGVYRFDITPENTIINQYRWTFEENYGGTYTGNLKTLVFRHYFTLRMTLLRNNKD